MEQFGKAIVAILLAACLAVFAVKVSKVVAAAVSETGSPLSYPESGQEAPAQN